MKDVLYLRDYVKKTCPPPQKKKQNISDSSLALALCWGSVKRWRWSRPCSQQFCGCFWVSLLPLWALAGRRTDGAGREAIWKGKMLGVTKQLRVFDSVILFNEVAEILWHDFWVERTRSFSDSSWNCWNLCVTHNRFWWFRRQKRSPQQEAMATQLE